MKRDDSFSTNSLRQSCGLTPPSEREAGKRGNASPPLGGGVSEADGGRNKQVFRSPLYMIFRESLIP